jgi:hypothetical protein
MSGAVVGRCPCGRYVGVLKHLSGVTDEPRCGACCLERVVPLFQAVRSSTSKKAPRRRAAAPKAKRPGTRGRKRR